MPVFTWLIALIGLAAIARAELPLARLTSIFPAGGQVGTTVEVTLTGQDLDEVALLHFGQPGITARPKPSPSTGQPEAGKFLIAIDPTVPPGLYDVRAVGRFGVTNPRTFQVGSTPQLVSKPGNTMAPTATDLVLGTAIQGIAEANVSHYFRLALKQGHRAVIEASTTTLDSRMEAVLAMTDAAGREVAQSHLGGTLDMVAPSDGNYLIAIHDVIFRGGPEFFYRLSANASPEAAPVHKPSLRWPYPPAAAFVEPVPAGNATIEIGKEPPHDRPELARKIELPCQVPGAFTGSHVRDWYNFDVPAGAVYWIEITCHRLGQPAAPMLLIQRITKDAKGQETVTDVQEAGEAPPPTVVPEFSLATRDPKLRFEAKEAGTYRLLVRNLVRGLSEKDVMPYRLSVRKESPDFGLVIVPLSSLPEPKDSKEVPISTSLLRRGGVTPIKVVALRRDGFSGEIQLRVDGLPPGVTAAPASIAPDASVATILLSAGESAAQWVGPIHVTGFAKIGPQEISHAAIPGTVNLSSYDVQNKLMLMTRSRVTDEYMLAVSAAESSPISIAPSTQPVWETSVAGKLAIPLKFTRRAEFVGPLTLKAAGHPLLAASKELGVDPKAETANLELDLTLTKLPPGQYTLYAEGQGKLKYINNPEAAKTAQATLEAVQKKGADLAAAVKLLEEVSAESAKANDAALKSAAEKVATEVKRRVASVEVEKASAANRLKEATAKAQPRDVTASFYSMPFVVKITAAPITFASTAAPIQLAPGSKIEMPISIHRLYGFADVVTIHLNLPPTAKGIVVPDITLTKDQSSAKLTLEAGKDAVVGEFIAKLQAKLKLNNQDLQIEQDVRVTIKP